MVCSDPETLGTEERKLRGSDLTKKTETHAAQRDLSASGCVRNCAHQERKGRAAWGAGPRRGEAVTGRVVDRTGPAWGPRARWAGLAWVGRRGLEARWAGPSEW